MIQFGTDGMRGIYGTEITEKLAYSVGKALGYVFGGNAVIGRDTRQSGQVLMEAVCRGINDMGGNVSLAGIVPTPALAYLTKATDVQFGVMITASHNSENYNGIKVFDCNGHKLPSSIEATIEYYMGCNLRLNGVRGKQTYMRKDVYLQYILSQIDFRLDGLRVLLDDGNGSGGELFMHAFESLGGVVTCINRSGGLINDGVGALHPNIVTQKMSSGNYDIGFSLDGDADRVVVQTDRMLAGDEVLYNLACKQNGKGGVVGTVLTNTATEEELHSIDKKLYRTAVGDKNISEVMRHFNYNLGGEPSGHYIISPQQTTGDGILTSLMMSYGDIRQLELYPQKSVSINADASILSDSRLLSVLKECRKLSRVVVRMSGTEPKLRVMVESENEHVLQVVIDEIITAIRSY